MKILWLGLAIVPAALLAQNPPVKIYPVPRGPDGKPDLTGIYQPASNRRGTWEEANSDGLAGNPFGATPGARTAPARGAAREPAPYQDWASKKVLESFNRRAIDDPTAFCLKPGVPRVTSVGLFPMQIVQTPKTIVMLYEYMNSQRVIPINARHPDDLEPSFMGDSVGRWDGDTLVVDVTSFNDKTWLIGAGTFHTESLHVTERYNMADRDMINYEATMEDPKVLTKPWVYRTTIMRREGTRLREYECEENNQDPARYEKLLKDESVFRRQ
ncbi:MAG TPA: hypothetical protein VKT49_09215 [Bryobacteraceae bacterium]|nr:hypothetical protein [Bryobacteraceae bacterium]